MNVNPILDVNRSGNQIDPPGHDAKPPLIAIVGPTASGKTGLALALAAELSIEIVNADSRAFYRGMDVGAAKPTAEERGSVAHHLIDILDPDEPMSISLFQHLAREQIVRIHGRRRIPVVVGGSPQYVNALVEGWRIPRVAPNHLFRQELEREAEQIGVEAILMRLRAVDPAAAERTGPNLRRIVRALEVFEATGVPFSEQRGRGNVPFAAVEVELWLPRDALYARIDRRVDEMIANGLVHEVRGLLDNGYDPDLPSFSGIGYRQLVPALALGGDLDQAIERIKLDTHRLVRHQQTWYRKNNRLFRIDMGMSDPVSRVLALAGDACQAFLDSA